jgi:succinoglycan biosynthesis transport protein ExoP
MSDGVILDEERLLVTGTDPSSATGDDGLVEKALRLLRQRWWVVLQALLVIPLAALVLSLLQDERWTATSTLSFEPARQNSGSVDLTREAATQSKLVALPSVAAGTASKLGGGWTPRTVAEAIEVSDVGDTNLVKVSATAPTPPGAVALANAYATAFVDQQVQANVRDAQRRLDVIDGYIESLPSAERTGPRGLRLQSRIDTLRINQALQSNDRRASAEVVQAAETPPAPSSPRTLRNVVLGLLLGAAVGLGLAALLERLDRTIKNVDELERLSQLPVLARIPRARGLAKRLRRSGAGEVLRALRANLRYFNVDGSLRSLLVVSPEAQDGKSTVVACLATAFAQRGDRVILVETDLHKNGDARGSGISPAEAVGAGASHDHGLSTVLIGGSLDEAIQMVELWTGDRDVESLAVLPSGPIPPNPSQLLGSRRMRDLVKELAQRYDTVIYDSPAMGAVSDALALVHEVDGVLVVSRINYTSRDRTRELLKQLALLRANVLGAVANYADLPKQRGYDYYRS